MPYRCVVTTAPVDHTNTSENLQDERLHLKTTHCFTRRVSLSSPSLPVSQWDLWETIFRFSSASWLCLLPFHFVLPWSSDNNNQQVRKAMSEVEQAPREPELSSYQLLLSQSLLKKWTLSEEWVQDGLQDLKVEIEMDFSGWCRQPLRHQSLKKAPGRKHFTARTMSLHLT